ncbi:retrovirus-related pol polyprotein from transposon TNT 1-94 [Tanacetum coccineum]
MNKNRKVRFAEPITSTSNTHKLAELHINQTTNKSLLNSTRVNSSTNASGSKPKGNTRNNRISRSSSSNQKNKKVEDHPRNVKSSLNKKNRVSVRNESTKHVVLNANSKFVCFIRNECLFLANHDMCVVDYLNDVNSLTRAKSGQTFPIDGTTCLLTRITSTQIVPPKKSGQTKEIKETPLSRVSQGTPNETKNLGLRNKPKIVESRISNNSKPNKNWGSNVSSSPSSFRFQRSKFMETVRFENDQVAAIMGYGDYQIGNFTISMVYYVEGLGHNLFSVGKSKKHPHKPKYEDSIQETMFAWVKFLRSKDETPEFIIKFLEQVQVRLNATVRNIRTDNGTEFVNQTLKSYYEDASLFLWAEAVAIACYTQNRTDNANITRKWSKPEKHGHGN